MNLEYNKIRRVIEIVSVILISCVFFFACSGGKAKDKEILSFSEEQSPAETESEISSPSPAAEIREQTVWVYVCGAVNQPGVYELSADARKADALNAAGGFTEDAATDAVNLAAHIEDADMLRIPHVGEVCEPEEDGFEQSEMTRKVNINTASESELMTLPGIGKSKAEAITEYRKKAGGFSCIEDLMKVPGIKEGTFERIKEQIRTE